MKLVKAGMTPFINYLMKIDRLIEYSVSFYRIMLNWLLEQNWVQSFWSLGMMTGITGGLFWSLKWLLGYLWELILAQLLVNIVVRETDSPELFGWLSQWLVEQSTVKGFSGIRAKLRRDLSSEDQDERAISTNLEDIDSDEEIVYLPGLGLHWFRFKGRMIWFNWSTGAKNAGTIQHSGDRPVGPPQEIYLYCFKWIRGEGGGKILKQLLESTRNKALSKRKDQVALYENTRHWCSNWTRGLILPKISWNSVILADGLSEKILADCQNFLNRREWYRSRGVPYRRGYLLYGPPGSGKSSMVHALASRLGKDICPLSLTGGADMSDRRLQEQIRKAPAHSIILLEDLESMFPDRQKKRQDTLLKKIGWSDDSPSFRFCSVTLSGLLNALDGATAQQGKLCFMTTNYPELLDEALLRPGRIDQKFEIGYATESQLTRIFLKFYPDAELSVAKKFGKIKEQLDAERDDLIHSVETAYNCGVVDDNADNSSDDVDEDAMEWSKYVVQPLTMRPISMAEAQKYLIEASIGEEEEDYDSIANRALAYFREMKRQDLEISARRMQEWVELRQSFLEKKQAKKKLTKTGTPSDVITNSDSGLAVALKLKEM